MNIKSMLLVVAITGLLFSSCTDDEENQDDKTKKEAVQLDKHGAVNVTVAETTDSVHTFLYTQKDVYDLSGTKIKTLLTIDTIPFIGFAKDTLDTGKTYEDENGDDQPVDTVITHPKHYNYYFAIKTVKK